MNELFTVMPILAQAQQGANGGGGGLIGIGYMVLLVGVMYFLLLRPQQQKAKQHREMVSRLKAGDQVVTNGGIYGEVTAVDESDVKLKVSEGVELKIVKSAVGQVLNEQEESAERDTKKSKS